MARTKQSQQQQASQSNKEPPNGNRSTSVAASSCTGNRNRSTSVAAASHTKRTTKKKGPPVPVRDDQTDLLFIKPEPKDKKNAFIGLCILIQPEEPPTLGSIMLEVAHQPKYLLGYVQPQEYLFAWALSHTPEELAKKWADMVQEDKLTFQHLHSKTAKTPTTGNRILSTGFGEEHTSSK